MECDGSASRHHDKSSRTIRHAGLGGRTPQAGADLPRRAAHRRSLCRLVDPRIGHQTSPDGRRHPNVLLLRTLSKGYSLAGLRLAYGLGAAELVAPMLSKTKDSYNVDAIAQAVGTAALEDVRSAAGSWEAGVP